MAARRREWHILQEAKKEALLAVDLYNRPAKDRTLEGFIVHMGIAWLYLAHATFVRDKIDHRYKDGGRVQKIDGEPKTWDLARSLRQLYPDPDDPVRRNAEFFLKFRNKIEHRYSPLLEAVVAGRAQSYIINFEETVVSEFGQVESLGQALRLPVFLTTLTEDSVAAVKKAYELLPSRVRAFIEEYDQEIPQAVKNHPAYEFRVYLIPKTSSKNEADAAVEFVKLADLTPEKRAKVEESLVIIKDRQVNVSNMGNLKPTAAAGAVQAGIPWKFSPYYHHNEAAKFFKVRPANGAARTATDTRYCVYDEPHNDYVYTPAWVKKLIAELQTPEGYKTVFGKNPVPKAAAAKA